MTGLAPDTTYYYSVGTTTATLAGNTADHFFVTSPPAGTAKPTRVWVLGDSGTADANARAVRDALPRVHRRRPPTDLWLMLGDNAYTTGTDAEYQAAVFDMYPTMLRKSVLWPTLGNHDGMSADSATQTGPYYDIFTLPRRRPGRRRRRRAPRPTTRSTTATSTSSASTRTRPTARPAAR